MIICSFRRSFLILLCALGGCASQTSQVKPAETPITGIYMPSWTDTPSSALASGRKTKTLGKTPIPTKRGQAPAD
jgi:hypothetical protein